MRLADVVATAVADPHAPAAALALAYAESIDEATHVPLGLAAALRYVEAAVATAAKADPIAYAGAQAAFDKVAAALSAVAVTSDLGPKLLATLDALLLTPKALGATDRALSAVAPADPLAKLRERHDGRVLRAVS